MDKKKKIFIGADHAGYELKEKIKSYLLNEGVSLEDVGALGFDSGDDYPDYAAMVAKKVIKNNGLGILVCNSGVGMCITANKIKGIRAVNASNEDIAEKSKLHNNTNILCLGQAFINEDLAKKIVRKWLDADFIKEERHQRRIDKIAMYEA
jgi:ribose 5-phosphate isomerase B